MPACDPLYDRGLPYVDRMNRNPLGGCFRLTGRMTWYLEPAAIQRDSDRALAYYNLEWSHQGYRLVGRTLAQALRDALGVSESPPAGPPRERGGGVSRCVRQARRLGIGELLNPNSRRTTQLEQTDVPSIKPLSCLRSTTAL